MVYFAKHIFVTRSGIQCGFEVARTGFQVRPEYKSYSDGLGLQSPSATSRRAGVHFLGLVLWGSFDLLPGPPHKVRNF